MAAFNFEKSEAPWLVLNSLHVSHVHSCKHPFDDHSMSRYKLDSVIPTENSRSKNVSASNKLAQNLMRFQFIVCVAFQLLFN